MLRIGTSIFFDNYSCLMPCLRCAPLILLIASQGTATRDDIDKTLRLGMGHPMGPLQLGDIFVRLSDEWVLTDAHALSHHDELQLTCERFVFFTLFCSFCVLHSFSIGLDTCLAIQETLYEGTHDSKYRPSVLLGRMVDAGWLGKKSGKGFYEY